MVNKNLEFTILRFFLEDLNFYRELPSNFFADVDSINFYNFLQEYIKKYKTLPTKNTIEDQKDETIHLIYLEIVSKPTDMQEFNYYADKMYDNYLQRRLYNIGEIISNGLIVKSGDELKKDVIAQVSEVKNPFIDIGNVVRSFYYENAKARWDRYVEVVKNPNARYGIPWGIVSFDEVTKGAQPGWLICLFAQSKVGKTRVMSNLAFNQAIHEKADVMWVAREMGHEDMENIFDSRFALIEQNQIRDGKLSKDASDKYLKILKQLEKDLPNLYIVDIPFTCTPIEIENELLQYRMIRGKFPDVIYLDYANLMAPAQKFSSTSERYNFLFQELHEITRKYRVAMVTAVQEGREGAKEKDKDKIDSSHIGLSHYIVSHVEMMIHLSKEGTDTFTNALKWKITESRHTAATSFSTFAFFEVNYIGDREVKGLNA